MIQLDLLNKISGMQAAIWQTVTLQVSEACGQAVDFTNPMALTTTVADAVTAFSASHVLLSFGFAGRPGSSQTLLLPSEVGHGLYELVSEEPIEDLDDANVSNLRGPLEAMVQGICLAIGNERNEIVVATDLSIRVAPFTKPSNLQTTDDLLQIQLRVGTEAPMGMLTWLVDADTAAFVGNLSAQPEEVIIDTPVFTPPMVGGATENPRLPTNAPHLPGEEDNGLSILMDIPLDISVELGRTRMVVKEIVDLGVGSIVEIDKAAGEPVDIKVNGRLVARGEVVVIEDNFGVRITEILSPRERLNRLGEAA